MNENAGCWVAMVAVVLLIGGCLNSEFYESCKKPRVYKGEELRRYFSFPSHMLRDDYGNLLLFSDLSYSAMRECCEEAYGRWANDKMPYRCVVYPRGYSDEELARAGLPPTGGGVSAGTIASMDEYLFTSCVRRAYKNDFFNTYVFNEETFDWEPINPSDFFEARNPQ